MREAENFCDGVCKRRQCAKISGFYSRRVIQKCWRLLMLKFNGLCSGKNIWRFSVQWHKFLGVWESCPGPPVTLSASPYHYKAPPVTLSASPYHYKAENRKYILCNFEWRYSNKFRFVDTLRIFIQTKTYTKKEF